MASKRRMTRSGFPRREALFRPSEAPWIAERKPSRVPKGDLMKSVRRVSPTAARGLALVAALLLLVLSLTLLAPPRAEALPACGTHYKYYSSAALTTQVGYR